MDVCEQGWAAPMPGSGFPFKPGSITERLPRAGHHPGGSLGSETEERPRAESGAVVAA